MFVLNVIRDILHLFVTIRTDARCHLGVTYKIILSKYDWTSLFNAKYNIQSWYKCCFQWQHFPLFSTGLRHMTSQFILAGENFGTMGTWKFSRTMEVFNMTLKIWNNALGTNWTNTTSIGGQLRDWDGSAWKLKQLVLDLNDIFSPDEL